MKRQLRTLASGGTFFEGPRWRKGCWWVSDFYRHAVYAVTPEGEMSKAVDVPKQPSGLGWMPDGSMLIVSMRDQRLLRWTPDGELLEHADLSAHTPQLLNDMVVDQQGRAWVGHFGFDLMSGEDPRPTSLLCVDLDGSSEVVADGLYFPNGMVITPDGTTLIVAESFGCRFSAFTVGQDGQLHDRRVWAQLAPTPELGSFEDVLPQLEVGPDGCSLDAEGCIWVADAFNGRCLRVAEGGEIVESIAMPDGLQAFACMLGGNDGCTMLICSAPDFHEEVRAASREALLLTCRVDVPHAGIP